MSKINTTFGIRWKIDGVSAGPIDRVHGKNGEYRVIFERVYASLEDIETINLSQPAIEYVGVHKSEPGLPEGYGFEVLKIEYVSGTKHYVVSLKTASQYLGDVTGYQAQIADLESAAAEKDSTISTQATQLQDQATTIEAQASQLQDQAATIGEQATTIEAQAAAIQELQEAGTAADLEAELDAAYEEGVNSVE